MTASILDELILVRSPLQPVTIDYAARYLEADRVLDTSVNLSRWLPSQQKAIEDSQVSKALSPSRQLSLSVPLVIRHIAQRDLGKYWAAFCRVLQEYGIPICCAVGELEPVGVEHLPLRIGNRSADHGFDRAELDNADAFELDCRHRHGQVWGWPSELGNRPDLMPLVSAARELLDTGTPLGIVLPAGAAEQDVCLALDSGADFITLVSPAGGRFSHLLVHSLVRIKDLCASRNFPPVPVIIDAPLTSISHVSVCLSLGASLVAIDSFIRPLFASTNTPDIEPVGGGMLTRITANTTLVVDPMVEIRARVQEILVDIRQHMHLCGASKLVEMNAKYLRAVSSQAAKLAGVSEL